MENDFLSETTSQNDLAICSEDNQAVAVCLNSECKTQSFTCNDIKCDCHTHHQTCQKIPIETLQKLILSNSYPLLQLQSKIQSVFNSAIHNLFKKKQQFLSRIDKDFHYFGLNTIEEKFLHATKKGTNNQDITGNFVWNLHNQLKRQTQPKQKWEILEKQILEIGKDLDKQIKEFNRRLTNLVRNVNQKTTDIFLTSKVIQKIQDTNKLIGFFKQKKIDSAKMLYRASQNEFSVRAFEKKCNKIPNTLTIVETQFGKIIGGFTAHVWSKPPESMEMHWLSANGNLKDHFIFSLTNNDKFTLSYPGDNCILEQDRFWSYSYGPVFGLGHDLRIFDKANEYNQSCANPGRTYKNPKYKCNDEYSHQKFAGGKNFHIKEWEVWEISFKQQGLKDGEMTQHAEK